MKKKILLHACCAPCAAGVYTQLKADFEITLFWYNPNIFPKAEHDRRLNELLNFCDRENIRIMFGDYDWVEEHGFWIQVVKGLEDEPECGKRCEKCFETRLEATAAVAAQANDHHDHNEFSAKGGPAYGWNLFGTTLSISPHKEAKMINEIGERVGKKFEVDFYISNFKKQDGSKKAAEISLKNKMYRQHYCGCEFSKNHS